MSEQPSGGSPWWARGDDQRGDDQRGDAPREDPRPHDPWRPPSDVPVPPAPDGAASPAPAPAPPAPAPPTATGLGWPASPAGGGGDGSGGSGLGFPAYGEASPGIEHTAVLDTLGSPERPPGRRRTGVLVAGGVAIALVAGALGGGIGAWVAENRTPVTSVSLPAAAKGSSERPADTVAGVAQRVLPAVVSINVRSAGQGDTGSGFVIRSDGYVLTNNHVVAAAAAGAGTITVELADGRSVPARIVGRSQDFDLAVLKLDLRGLPALTLGDSGSVVVGDSVIAIGSPLGLSGTVTTGIISAEDRPVIAGDDANSQSYINALQTDAAINPGNSGGPLVDAAGRVIGVNSAIASLGGQSPFGQVQTGSIGLGFAIPINQARDVAEQLINTGQVRYPVIGVSLDSRYEGDGAKIFDGRTGAGPAVQPDGPAAKAGLQPGDVIVSFDGRNVASGPELIVAIRTRKPGETVEIGYLRGGGAVQKTRLTLGSAVERLSR